MREAILTTLGDLMVECDMIDQPVLPLDDLAAMGLAQFDSIDLTGLCYRIGRQWGINIAGWPEHLRQKLFDFSQDQVNVPEPTVGDLADLVVEVTTRSGSDSGADSPKRSVAPGMGPFSNP